MPTEDEEVVRPGEIAVGMDALLGPVIWGADAGRGGVTGTAAGTGAVGTTSGADNGA